MMASGLIAAEIANYAGKMRPEGAEPASPLDYVPPAWNAPREKKSELTIDEQMDAIVARIKQIAKNKNV